MDIHCFASAKKTMTRIRSAVAAAGVGGMASEMSATAELYRLLCMPRQPQSIFILCPKNRQELEELLSVSALLRGAKVILILPKLGRSSERAAHGLLPCFLAFADEDFSAITMILQKVSSSFSGSAQPNNSKKGKKDGRASRPPGH